MRLLISAALAAVTLVSHAHAAILTVTAIMARSIHSRILALRIAGRQRVFGAVLLTVAANMVCLTGQSYGATLVGPPANALGIDGLSIDGTLYDVRFLHTTYNSAFYSSAPTFLGNQQGAVDAAFAIGAALTSFGGVAGLVGAPSGSVPDIIVPYCVLCYSPNPPLGQGTQGSGPAYTYGLGAFVQFVGGQWAGYPDLSASIVIEPNTTYRSGVDYAVISVSNTP